MVRSYKGHHSAWIQNVHMQRGGNRELVSGSYVLLPLSLSLFGMELIGWG